MDMRDINFVSGGRNPNCEPVCRTCSFRILDKENSDWGWCPINKNCSVSPTGGCDKHSSQKETK